MSSGILKARPTTEEYSSRSHPLFFSRQQTRTTIQSDSGQRDFERMYVCEVQHLESSRRTDGFSRCCVLVGQMQTALLEIRGPFRTWFRISSPFNKIGRQISSRSYYHRMLVRSVFFCVMSTLDLTAPAVDQPSLLLLPSKSVN